MWKFEPLQTVLQVQPLTENDMIVASLFPGKAITVIAVKLATLPVSTECPRQRGCFSKTVASQKGSDAVTSCAASWLSLWPMLCTTLRTT